MHSKELHVRVFQGIISFLLSPLLFVGNVGMSTAWAQETPSAAGAMADAAGGATVHAGKVQLENETVGLSKPKNKNAFGKVVYREGTVKVDNKDAPAGSEIKAGSLLEAGADGRALIVLKKKARQTARFNPEDLLGGAKKPKKKVKALNATRVAPKAKPAAQSATVAAKPKKPKKRQMGLSKGIDVRRLQYIALVGDAQAKMTDNEIAIETKDGEAIITQGTSRILNLGPNSKMRVPAQPQSGITGTLCHGTLTGVAKPSVAANGPNIETSSGIVNFPSGGRFLVEAAGSGPLQECDKEKKSETSGEKSGGIRVVSLDAPGRLILAHRPPPAPVVLPKFKKLEEPRSPKGNEPTPKDKPLSFSLAGEEPIDGRGGGAGSGGGGGVKPPDRDPQSTKKNEPWQPVNENDPKNKDKEKTTVSNLTDGTDGTKRTDDGGTKKDPEVAQKTNDPEREKKSSDGGEKKSPENEKKTAEKTPDDKQKNTGGKPTKSEDSPLDIDQGKGNDKFIGSDSPASKGADKRIALNDEKQHDGEDTRQPGTSGKEEKPPQSGKTEDSNSKTRDSDNQKTTSNLTADNEPERERKASGGDGGGSGGSGGSGGEKKSPENEKKTAEKTPDDKQENTGGKPTKPEDSPLDIDQGKGNDKFIGSDSPASKGADKRIALNDEKQHDGEDTRQPGTSGKEEKPPQSGKTEDSNSKTRDSDNQKTTSNLTADNEPERERKASGGDGGGSGGSGGGSGGSGGEKKSPENEKKTAEKTPDDKQKNTGGKPTKPEDSPLDIDQGKGNDKFIGSDSPASKGADKRIALNDEKQHDGEDTRQPGTSGKEEKPPQSGKTEDSNSKTRDSDNQKTTSNLTADNEPERERKASGGGSGGNGGSGGEKKSPENEKKTAEKTPDDKQKNTGGKPTKPEDSPLDIDQGKGNDKFIGSDSPASKGADKRIALNDEKQHDGEDTRQPGTSGKEEKPPQSGKTEDSNSKTRDSDNQKTTSNLTADNEPERERKASGGDGGGSGDRGGSGGSGGNGGSGGEKKSPENEKNTAEKTPDDKQKNTGGKPTKPEDSPLDIDQGKGNDKFIGSDSPASKGADKRIALNDEKQHDGEDTRQPGTSGKEEKPPQSGGGQPDQKSSGIKQNADGILEFAPMQDVKAPELPDMRDMNEKQKKEVYNLVAANTESAPASQSLLTSLVNQIPPDVALDLQKQEQGRNGSSSESQRSSVNEKSQSKQDSSSEKSKDNGPKTVAKSSEVKGSDEVESRKEDEQEESDSKSSKNAKKPLIKPPKMTPPPPPKIETTQMPLSSDVLIKLRKKVK